MSNDTITKTVFFEASRETVWSFLTESKKLALWFHPAQSDLAIQEEYALIQKADDGSTSKLCWGKVLEMDRIVRLAVFHGFLMYDPCCAVVCTAHS